MKSLMKNFPLWLALSLFLCGVALCALSPARGDLVQKTNNFLIILDISGSMADHYGTDSKFRHAQRTARYIATRIPEELHVQGGLRTFGYVALSPQRQTKLIIPVRDIIPDYFSNSIRDLDNEQGSASLAVALHAAKDDLAGLQGKTALIVISDGIENNAASVALAARQLKKTYGENLCIYAILVGDSAKGKAVLNKVVKAGKCGFATSYDLLDSKKKVDGFIRAVFYEERE